MKRRPVYLWLIMAFLCAFIAILLALHCIRNSEFTKEQIVTLFIFDGLAFFCAFMGLHNGKKEYF